jgi:hypothetical protein
MFAALNAFLTRSSGYFLNKSLRFRSSASAYLNRTFGTPTAQTKYTISVWVKRGSLGTTYSIFAAGSAAANDYDSLQFNSSTNAIAIFAKNGLTYEVNPTQALRDPAAWYHFIIAVDTTQATASNRVLWYINGTQVTSFSTATYPTQNSTSAFNRSGAVHAIGALYAGSYNQYFDGELAEFNFIDGQQLAPTAFGAFSTYNQWLPIKYAGTYGTNGFYLPFTNTTSTSTLVADSSGNGNNWTPNNISLTAGSTYDSLTDVPTLTSTTAANYAVLNPVNPKGNSTVSNGNLTEVITTVTGAGRGSTIAVTSGKFYVEATAIGAGAMVTSVGITSPSASTYQLYLAGVGYYSNNGNKYISGVGSAYGTAWASAGTYVIGMALDVGAGTLQFYLNNVAQGNITLPTMPSDGWIFVADWESSAGSVTYNWNYGQQPFVYTAPTGFLPLNTYNI